MSIPRFNPAAAALLLPALGFLCACATGQDAATSKAASPAVTEADIRRVIGPIENTFTALPGRFWAATGAPLLGNGDMGVCILGRSDDLSFMLGKNDFWHLRPGPTTGTALCFGSLRLTLPGLKGAALKITQRPAEAVTRGRLTLADGSGVDFTTQVCATENVLVLQLTAKDKPLAGEAKLVADTSAFKEDAKAGTGQGLAWITRDFIREVDVPTGASAALKVVGADGPSFTLEPGKTVTLLVAMKSNFNAKDHLAAAKALAQKADAGQLLAVHAVWWRDFWGKSLVEVADRASKTAARCPARSTRC